MEKKVRYGIGEQDFKSLRLRNCVYVDKTSFIYDIVDSGSKYYFLARPRRFGKSLFLSTLQYFFQGERELFKGLFIDSTGWQWEEYPVLRLDLNREKYLEVDLLDSILDNILFFWEKEYEVENRGSDLSSRFANVIRAAHEKTGKQVVILVDEYDKPLVGNLNDSSTFEHYRTKLAAIYSNFKSCAEHIRLVFLTGVSRFSKLSIFSDLNNLDDITFVDNYADICGITPNELTLYFQIGVKKLAEKQKVDFNHALKLLKENYDGYSFSKERTEIYNPWSLLNAFDKEEIRFFWNDTGLPTLLAESLKKINADLEQLFNSYCAFDDLKGLDLLNPDPVALMFQTGYLTIKDYDRYSDDVLLGIPNKEVKNGFFRTLLPYYSHTFPTPANKLVDEITRNFINGNPEKSMKAMQAYFSGIDYSMHMENENNFHNAFFLLLDLIGLKTKTESHTSEGRIDIEVLTERFIYVIELKYDHSAEAALHQIDEKKYTRKFQTDSRKLFKIGVEFSSKTRCIENWIISE